MLTTQTSTQTTTQRTPVPPAAVDPSSSSSSTDINDGGGGGGGGDSNGLDQQHSPSQHFEILDFAVQLPASITTATIMSHYNGMDTDSTSAAAINHNHNKKNETATNDHTRDASSFSSSSSCDHRLVSDDLNLNLNVNRMSLDMEGYNNQGHDPEDSCVGGGGDSYGIVGFITILSKKLVMVWVGWGPIIVLSSSSERDRESSCRHSVVSTGSSRCSIMGPLVVSMPRVKYSGAFSESSNAVSSSMPECATSKLIHHAAVDDDDAAVEWMSLQRMASRLSHQLGIAVMVSGSLQDHPPPQLQLQLQRQQLIQDPLERASVNQRALAWTEREVYRILHEYFFRFVANDRARNKIVTTGST